MALINAVDSFSAAGLSGRRGLVAQTISRCMAGSIKGCVRKSSEARNVLERAMSSGNHVKFGPS